MHYLQASAPSAANGGNQLYPTATSIDGIIPPPQYAQQQVPATLGTRPAPGVGQAAVSPVGADGVQGRISAAGRRSAAIANADASLESVERAMGEVRLASTNARTRRNNGGQRQSATAHAEITVPTTDFDFAGMNARFDKAALAPGRAKNGTEDGGDDDDTSEEEGEIKAKSKSPKPDESNASYNPKSSFFDSLSSSASGPPPRGGRGRGRGMARSRREEEREKNVATFGEPGGIGFMGPNAYVGGYGRRGGARGGRRGGGPRRNVAVVGTEA